MTKNEKKIEKEILVILLVMGALIGVFVLASMYFKSLNHFDYMGLGFTKEKYGELPIYHYYYYYEDNSGKPVQYNLYLQHDPRTNDVPYSGNKTIFNRKTVSISVGNDYPSTCRDNVASLVELTSFLRGNAFNVNIGFTNKTYADENKQNYITCSKDSTSEVIEIIGGNKTEIVVDGNCHKIMIGPECKIREAIEKFEVISLVDAKENP